MEGFIGTPKKPIIPAVTNSGNKFGINEMIIIRKERNVYAINSDIKKMARANDKTKFRTKYLVPF